MRQRAGQRSREHLTFSSYDGAQVRLWQTGDKDPLTHAVLICLDISFGTFHTPGCGRAGMRPDVCECAFVPCTPSKTAREGLLSPANASWLQAFLSPPRTSTCSLSLSHSATESELYESSTNESDRLHLLKPRLKESQGRFLTQVPSSLSSRSPVSSAGTWNEPLTVETRDTSPTCDST